MVPNLILITRVENDVLNIFLRLFRRIIGHHPPDLCPLDYSLWNELTKAMNWNRATPKMI